MQLLNFDNSKLLVLSKFYTVRTREGNREVLRWIRLEERQNLTFIRDVREGRRER